MLEGRELERVSASREQADWLLDVARTHLTSAAAIKAGDPSGAYQLLYDAARKALVSILENQGLRPTTRGGHLAVYAAVRAQMVPPLETTMRPFETIRRLRHATEYPSPDRPVVAAEDVDRDLPRAAELVDMAARVLDQMDVF